MTVGEQPLNTLDAAVARLEAALGTLESKIAIATDDVASSSVLEREVEELKVQQYRLAADRDQALDHANRMRAANEQVAQRLGAAIEAIKTAVPFDVSVAMVEQSKA